VSGQKPDDRSVLGDLDVIVLFSFIGNIEFLVVLPSQPG
jgi:hypothetical protein